MRWYSLPVRYYNTVPYGQAFCGVSHTHTHTYSVSRPGFRRLKRQKRKYVLYQRNKRLGRINFPSWSSGSINQASFLVWSIYTEEYVHAELPPYLLVVSPVCPWLSPLSHHCRTAYFSSNPLWYTERNPEDRNEWIWAMHVCSVQGAYRHTPYIHRHCTLHHEHWASLFFFFLNDRLLYAWPHLFLPYQSYFPRFFADSDPCKTFFPYHTLYRVHTIHTEESWWGWFRGGYKWIYGVWCELWVRRRRILRTYSLPCLLSPVRSIPYSWYFCCILDVNMMSDLDLESLSHTYYHHPSKTKISSIDK